MLIRFRNFTTINVHIKSFELASGSAKMAAILALSTLGKQNSKVYLKDKVDTYQHVSTAYGKSRLIFNGALYTLLAIKKTLETAIEVDDEEKETELFRKLCNPYIVEWTLTNCLGFEKSSGESDIVDFNPWEGFHNNVTYACLIDFSNTQIQRWYEELALKYMTSQTCDKLIKSVSNSAIRKAERFGSFTAATFMFQTTVKAQFLPCSAQFTVSQLVYFYYGKSDEKFSIVRYLGRDLPKELIKRIGVRLVVMGAGAAIGTAVKPGTGTTIALLATDFLVTPIACNVVESIFEGEK